MLALSTRCSSSADVDLVGHRLERLLAPFDRDDRPGVAIGVAVDGRPIFRKGAGLARQDERAKLTSATPIRIGASSNQFTALAFLQLCDAGLAALDAPLGTYLPELHPRARQVTMRQLMTQTSGLHDAFEICVRFGGLGRRIDQDGLLDFYREMGDSNAAPGAAWIYNNCAYLLVGAAIERIAGQPLGAVLRDRIFEPLGMVQSSLCPFDADLPPDAARAHVAADGGQFRVCDLGIVRGGESGIVASIDDLLRWLAQIHDPRIATADSWAALLKPQVLTDGSMTPYALGLIHGQWRGLATIGHVAGYWGGSAQLLKLPEAGLDIVILANRSDIWAATLAEQVLEICTGQTATATRRAGPPTAEGVYRSPSSGRVLEFLGGDDDPRAILDGLAVPLRAEVHGYRSYGLAAYLGLEIVPVPSPGAEPGLTIEQFGQADRFDRVARAGPSSSPHLPGRYRAQGCGIELIVAAPGGELAMQASGPFGRADFVLTPLARNLWRAQSSDNPALGAIVELAPDGVLTFSADRIRRLPFRRCSEDRSSGHD